MKKNLLLLILVLSVFGCKDQKTITDLFDSQKELSHKPLNVQEKSGGLLSPEDIEIKDNLMITLNGRSEKYFSLIDNETNVLVKSWGSRGEGPGEIASLFDFYKNYNSTGINAWDPMQRKLNFYSFENIVENDTLLPVDLFSDFESIRQTNLTEDFYTNMLQLSETLFMGQGNNVGKRFTLIDIKNQTRVSVGDYPAADKVKGLRSIFRSQAYNGLIRYNQKQNRVVYMSIESEMLEIFQVKGNYLNLIYGNYTTIPKYTVSTGMINAVVEGYTNGKGRFVSVAVSDEKIYTLYKQYTKEDSDPNIAPLISNDASYILVFDWDGKPLQKYKLDCFVGGIKYDEKSNRFYAVKTKPDPELIYFEL